MQLLLVGDNRIRFHEHEIEAAAKRCLRASPYNVFAGVSCECEHGVLVLRGRLSSFHHKQVAQEAVAGISGVTQVVNEIEVDWIELVAKGHWHQRRHDPGHR